MFWPALDPSKSVADRLQIRKFNQVQFLPWLDPRDVAAAPRLRKVPGGGSVAGFADISPCSWSCKIIRLHARYDRCFMSIIPLKETTYWRFEINTLRSQDLVKLAQYLRRRTTATARSQRILDLWLKLKACCAHIVYSWHCTKLVIRLPMIRRTLSHTHTSSQT
jgi:hypothetical protein